MQEASGVSRRAVLGGAAATGAMAALGTAGTARAAETTGTAGTPGRPAGQTSMVKQAFDVYPTVRVGEIGRAHV